MTDQPLSQVYLFVTPEGKIVSDKRQRVEQPGLETWRCEVFEKFFRVAMVYPRETTSQIIKIDSYSYQSLKEKYKKHMNRKVQNARHEAGHVILFYALKVAPVEGVDLQPCPALRGNLRDQLKSQVTLPSSVRIIGATTYSIYSEADQQARNTRLVLGETCLGFGGFIGSGGDQTGVDGDLDKIRYNVAGLINSARQGLFASNDFGQLATAPRLKHRLKSLAEEIMSNPTVASRHEQLAKQLAEKGRLNQQEIEAIIDPATLPDYSGHLEQIRKEFYLNEKFSG